MHIREELLELVYKMVEQDWAPMQVFIDEVIYRHGHEFGDKLSSAIVARETEAIDRAFALGFRMAMRPEILIFADEDQGYMEKSQNFKVAVL